MYKFLLLGLLAQHVWSANILFVGVTISHSHHFWIETIALGLADKGHNVTFFSNDPTKVKRENYTVLTSDGIYEKFDYVYASTDFQQSVTLSSIPIMTDLILDFMVETCKFNIYHSSLRKLLSYPKNHFDLILFDNTEGDCLYPLIDYFGNPPVIGLSPYGLSDTINYIYKGPVYPYIGQLAMPFAEAKTFFERLLNVAFTTYNAYRRESLYIPKSVELSKEIFPNWSIEKFQATEREFNLVLLNWNVAVNQPQPLLPYMIPVGGVQIKTGIPMTKDFNNIFKKASKGVIYFSLGSNSKSEDLTPAALKSFADCFADLPDYQIIWKITPPKGLQLSSNINAVKFAPQTAILEHPKTKLFITHGGGLSTQETSYFGVPIVGIPIFLDQTNNIEKLKLRGGGEIVSLYEMKTAKTPQQSKDIFCKNVKKVLFEKSYSEVMKKVAMRYQDREVHPLDTSIYWVEYILRHGDAKHLRPLSYDMCVFYTQNLDLYLVVLIILGGIILVIWSLVKSCLCSSKKPSIDSKKKKH